MPPSHPKIHKNALISSDHILALTLQGKISNKPLPTSQPMWELELKKWNIKLIKKKKISKKVLDKWNMKHKENGKKENSKLSKLLINNPELLKTSLPPSQRVGKKLNRFLLNFMKLQNKNYMKLQLHKLNKKLVKQSKTLKKEQEILNKVSKMLEEMFKENIKKENGKLRKQREWNHKNLFMKMSKKLLPKIGKTWKKVLRMFMKKLHKKLVKLSVLMLKVKPNKPRKISNKAQKRQNNHLKKLSCLKNQLLNKPNKSYKNGLEPMLKVRQKMLKSISKKEPRTLSKAQRKQLDMKVPSFSKPNKTSLKDGRTLRKQPKIHTIKQLRSWATLGVQYKKQLDRKLNKQAKLWKRRATRCNRTPETDYYLRMILKILYIKDLI